MIITLLGSPMVIPSGIHDFSENQKVTESLLPVSPLENTTKKIEDILNHINETILYKFLEELVAFGPRLTETLPCEQAAAYLFDQFSQMGLHTCYHNWSFWSPDLSPRVYTGSNIVATLPGKNISSDHVIIFNAHYDTSRISPGADDDASGVASVLAAAYALSQYQFEHTLQFIAFSGEEEGLLGSKAYARRAYENHDNILAAFNADMIGFTQTAAGGKTFRIYASEDASWIIDTAMNINNNHGFGYTFNTGTISGRGGGGSDYYSFLQYGFDALAFFEGEWNPYMHTANDIIANLNVSYLTKNTCLITGILATLADARVSHPQVKLITPQRGRFYIDGKIVNTLLTEQTIVINDILIEVEISPGDYPLAKVEFYYDNTLKYTDGSPPYQWRMDLFSLGTHEIKVLIHDAAGQVTQDRIFLYYFNLPHIR